MYALCIVYCFHCVHCVHWEMCLLSTAIIIYCVHRFIVHFMQSTLYFKVIQPQGPAGLWTSIFWTDWSRWIGRNIFEVGCLLSIPCKYVYYICVNTFAFGDLWVHVGLNLKYLANHTFFCFEFKSKIYIHLHSYLFRASVITFELHRFKLSPGGDTSQLALHFWNPGH